LVECNRKEPMRILKDIPRDPTPDGQGSGTDSGTGNETAVPIDSGSTDSTPTETDSTTIPS
jgi:hypothetical protein